MDYYKNLDWSNDKLTYDELLSMMIWFENNATNIKNILKYFSVSVRTKNYIEHYIQIDDNTQSTSKMPYYCRYTRFSNEIIL